MQKTLMILGAGNNEAPAIQKAKTLGISTVVCDMNKNAPGLKLGDHNIVAKTKDIKEYLEIAKRHKIDGVMTVSVESLVCTVSKIAQDLGLPGISKEAALNVTNKIRMKEVLSKNNIPVSPFISAKSLSEAIEKAGFLKFPLVIKPADRAGSRGVFKVKDKKNLSKFFNVSLGESRCGEVILEEFVDGIESTVDSVTIKGKTYVLGISDKKKIETPNIIAMDLTFPPDYSRSMQEKVKEIVRDALRALSVDFGPSHVEVIVNDKGPKVIEVAGRAGGGLIPSDILPHLCNFDVIETYINLALGETPTIPDFKPEKSVVLRFFKAPKEGVLDKIVGAEEAIRMKNVLKLDFIVKKGDRLKALKEDNDRIGFAIVKGKDRTQASQIADKVEELIEFEVG